MHISVACHTVLSYLSRLSSVNPLRCFFCPIYQIAQHFGLDRCTTIVLMRHITQQLHIHYDSRTGYCYLPTKKTNLDSTSSHQIRAYRALFRLPTHIPFLRNIFYDVKVKISKNKRLTALLAHKIRTSFPSLSSLSHSTPRIVKEKTWQEKIVKKREEGVLFLLQKWVKTLYYDIKQTRHTMTQQYHGPFSTTATPQEWEDMGSHDTREDAKKVIDLFNTIISSADTNSIQQKIAYKMDKNIRMIARRLSMRDCDGVRCITVEGIERMMRRQMRRWGHDPKTLHLMNLYTLFRWPDSPDSEDLFLKFYEVMDDVPVVTAKLMTSKAKLFVVGE